TIQLTLLGSSSILAIILWLAAPALMPLMDIPPQTERLFLMMIGILWFDTLSLVPFAELRLVRKTWIYAGLRTLNVLINIGLNLWLILSLHLGIEAVFIANIMASGITTLILAVYTRKMWQGVLKKSIFRRAIAFGLPFVPAGL